MADFIDVVAWICVVDGRILTARSTGKDLFYIPGGKREAGESDVETLIREVKEELTVDIVAESAEHFKTYHTQAHAQPDGVMVRMACYTADHRGTAEPVAEIAEIEWMSYSDRDRTAQADRDLFDDLVAAGMLV